MHHKLKCKMENYRTFRGEKRKKEIFGIKPRQSILKTWPKKHNP